MKSDVDFLKEIHTKYAVLESSLDQKLAKILQDEQKFEEAVAKGTISKIPPTNENSQICSSEEAKKRNAQLVKALEASKARLRSRGLYSPVEYILSRAISDYVKSHSDIFPVREPTNAND